MPPKFFIGRDRELSVFLDELNESDQFKDPSRIFYLRGQQGMGKRAFYSQLWKQLHSTALKVIWIRPTNWVNVTDPGEWPDLLTVSIEGNNDVIGERIQAFRSAWAELPQQVPVLQEAKYEASVSGFQADQTDIRMEHWFSLFKRVVIQGDNGQAHDPNLRLIFVLDSYDYLSVEQKQWFSRSLFESLVADVSTLDIRFLLSGERSFYQTLDLESYWIPFQTEVKEVELSPLSPDETREFARMSNVLLGEDIDLHEKTGGVPGVIEEKLRSGKMQQGVLRQVEEVENFFSDKSEEYCNWIMGAVHLQVFDVESLSIFGSARGAKIVLNKLIEDEDLGVVAIEGGFKVNPSWADAILRWQEQFKPEQYRRLAQRVAEFREILDQIPDFEHRQKLAKLSVFNYFNTNLIRKIYNGDGDNYAAFVRRHLDYFIKTPFNYQVSMQYLPFVQNYVRLIPLVENDRLREEVQYIWEKRRNVINEESEDIDQRLRETRQDQATNKERLYPVIEQLKRRERIVKINKKRRAPKFTNKIKYSDPSRRARMGLQGVGCFLLVFGILFNVLMDNPIEWVFVAFGLFFVSIGAFWPKASEKVQGVERFRGGDYDEPDTLVNMLNLKMVGLENRASFLAMEATKYQRKIRELDAQISEPYS